MRVSELTSHPHHKAWAAYFTDKLGDKLIGVYHTRKQVLVGSGPAWRHVAVAIFTANGKLNCTIGARSCHISDQYVRYVGFRGAMREALGRAIGCITKGTAPDFDIEPAKSPMGQVKNLISEHTYLLDDFTSFSCDPDDGAFNEHGRVQFKVKNNVGQYETLI